VRYAVELAITLHRRSEYGSCSSVSLRHCRRTDHSAPHSSEASDFDARLWRPASRYQPKNAQAQPILIRAASNLRFQPRRSGALVSAAADLDTNWPSPIGDGEAVGPNYNDPPATTASSGSYGHPEGGALSVVLRPVSRLTSRPWRCVFRRSPGGPPAGAEAYHGAMPKWSKQFPDDLDAATLFAESA